MYHHRSSRVPVASAFISKAAMNGPYAGRPAVKSLARGANRFPTLLAAGLVASSFLSLSVPSAANGCEQWSVQGAGNQTFVQSNGFAPVFALAQAGSEIAGSALYSPDRPGGSVNGKVTGRIKGNFLQLTVDWKGNTTGVYTGTIGNDGQIEGKTYDRAHPSSQASWYSTTLLRCLTRAEADSCLEYAIKAAAATQEILQLGCEANGPPRWSENLNAQTDWCMWHQELANAETAARADAVESCRQQIAQSKSDLAKSKLGIEQKASEGVGQVLQPKDKLGIGNSPSGGVGEFLKHDNP